MVQFTPLEEEIWEETVNDMKDTRFPLPRKYWIYVALCAILAILLFMNIPGRSIELCPDAEHLLLLAPVFPLRGIGLRVFMMPVSLVLKQQSFRSAMMNR